MESALRANPRPEDVEDAKHVVSDACAQGSQEACSVLGVMLAEGLGFPRDSARASELFRGACDGGVARACTNLGRLERARDLGLAIVLFQSGCDGGDAHGCAELGRFARDGVGGSTDLALAESLLLTACQGGDGNACADVLGLPAASSTAFELAASEECVLGNARACASYSARAGRRVAWAR